MSNLARAHILRGGRDDEGDSEALYRRALAIRRKALGPDHPAIASSLRNLSEVMLRLGRSEEAQPLVEEALAILTQAFGPDHAAVGECWFSLSRAYDANGRMAEAVDAARNAVATAERGGQEGFGIARPRMQLGKLRWRLGEDLAGARRLVEQAGATMAKTPDRAPAEQAEVQAWLRAHPLPSGVSVTVQ